MILLLSSNWAIQNRQLCCFARGLVEHERHAEIQHA